MKYIIINFLFFFNFSKCLAQSILVEYEDKRAEQEKDITNYTNVWITDSITTRKGQYGNSKESSFVKKKKESFLYHTVYLFSKEFDVKDSLHNFNWVLGTDTATILNRKCVSAKTFFRGREYKVFYAPSIPVSDGPWKFGGLPGLILEAKSTDGYATWRTIKLDLAYKGSFLYVDTSKKNYLSWQELIKVYGEVVDKLAHSMRSQNEVSKNGGKFKFQVPSLEIIHPKLNGEGVEIED